MSTIDVYQCMNCGDRWVHGGLRDSFIRAANHFEETRGAPEGGHIVLVGEIDALQAQYEAIKAGKQGMPVFNDNNNPLENRRLDGQVDVW